MRVPIANRPDLVCLVDEEDFERVSAFNWYFGGHRYAMRKEGNRAVYMHREILGAPPGMEVDHVNGEGLDNRRSNLRWATRSQNMKNKRGICGTSRFKGVCWNRRAKKWQAEITSDGQARYLGIFTDEEAAARAYDAAARSLHGEFAAVNFGGDLPLHNSQHP